MIVAENLQEFKLDELIAALQKARVKLGDVPVWVSDSHANAVGITMIETQRLNQKVVILS